MAFQFSGQHKFFLGVSDATPGPEGTPLETNATVDSAGDPEAGVASPVTVNTLWAAGDLQLYKNIRDLNEAGSNNTVNITTREEAELGISSEVIATTTRTLTTEILYQPANFTTGAATDLLYKALKLASINKTGIFVMDLDADPNDASIDGASGYGATYRVALSTAKPVEGVVTVTATFSGPTKGQELVWDKTAGVFKPLS